MKQLQPEELFILACAKIEPSAEEIDRMNNLIPQIKKWDYTLKLAIENGMAPLVYKKIPLLGNGSLVPEQIRKSLQQVYYKTLSFGTILYQSFNEVVTAFKAEKIDVIPLKGILLAENLYKDIGLRQLSDIDLLVREDDLDRCVNIMKGLGYIQDEHRAKFFEENVDFIHCAHIIKGAAKYDLHRKIHKDKESFYVDIQNLWKNAINIELNGAQVQGLDINHLLIHLCLHLEKHFGMEIVQYKCFCDIVNLLELRKESIDWKGLEELCLKYNCTSNVFKYLLLSSKFFNAYIPNDIALKHSESLTNGFIKQFIENFKNKNSWGTISVAQLKMRSGIRNNTRYILRTFFPTVGFMASRYRISNKILLPYFYIFRWYKGLEQLFRYAYKRLKTR